MPKKRLRSRIILDYEVISNDVIGGLRWRRTWTRNNEFTEFKCPRGNDIASIQLSDGTQCFIYKDGSSKKTDPDGKRHYMSPIGERIHRDMPGVCEAMHAFFHDEER